jgi:hypothetical protein
MTSLQPGRPTPAGYEIRVRGHLGARMLRAFPALRAETQGQDTLLRGVADQAALHGVLAQIETLGLELLEVRRLPPRTEDQPASPDTEGRPATATPATWLSA